MIILIIAIFTAISIVNNYYLLVTTNKITYSYTVQLVFIV